jgi:SPP1 family predicted phage head-tail adaptor
MNSGDFDTRVRIDERTELTQDTAGQPEVTWVEVATLWAKKKSLSGRELFVAQQVTPSLQEEFWIRWRSDLADPAFTLKCRLVHGDTAYDITYVGEIGRREGLRLLVKLPGEE